MSDKQNITLVFTVAEINTILNMIAEFPYNKSAGLISKIQNQAYAQVNQTVTDSVPLD